MNKLIQVLAACFVSFVAFILGCITEDIKKTAICGMIGGLCWVVARNIQRGRKQAVQA